MQRNFLFILGSGRRDGNSEQLARQAALHLPADAQAEWLHLLDLPMPPFEDIRHSVGVYPQPVGSEKTLFDATLVATDIVFVTPLY
ncbi:MAG: flavodoxin, partial [Saprospiraceae bacterium]|nr:flavodoxin [Saprospiraceae bacterium]